jgi:hypothetical protein
MNSSLSQLTPNLIAGPACKANVAKKNRLADMAYFSPSSLQSAAPSVNCFRCWPPACTISGRRSSLTPSPTYTPHPRPSSLAPTLLLEPDQDRWCKYFLLFKKNTSHIIFIYARHRYLLSLWDMSFKLLGQVKGGECQASKVSGLVTVDRDFEAMRNLLGDS